MSKNGEPIEPMRYINEYEVFYANFSGLAVERLSTYIRFVDCDRAVACAQAANVKTPEGCFFWVENVGARPDASDGTERAAS